MSNQYGRLKYIWKLLLKVIGYGVIVLSIAFVGVIYGYYVFVYKPANKAEVTAIAIEPESPYVEVPKVATHVATSSPQSSEADTSLLVSNALEPRIIVADFDVFRGKLTSSEKQCFDTLAGNISFNKGNITADKQKAIHVFAAASSIRELIKSEDSLGLIELIKSELITGPTKQFMKSTPFDAVFSKSWVANFQDKWEYPCGALKDYFMLGDSSSPLWFFIRTDGSPQIVSIIGLQEEVIKSKGSDVWTHGSFLDINPNCFTTYWSSADNYEAFADTFELGEYGDTVFEEFGSNPGAFIGKEIPIDAVLDPWSDAQPIYLSPTIAQCNNFADRDGPLKYTVYGEYEPSACKVLAPNLPGSCVDIKLVKVDGPFGYSSVESHTALYALVELYETEQVHVIPLLNFDSLNEGLAKTSLHLKATGDK